MPAWLILVLVGVVLVILGIATNIGQFLIWLGVIILVASLVLGLVRRSCCPRSPPTVSRCCSPRRPPTA
ncbi:hypothetical protein [Isoptericola sp. NPDC057391]|uniref:hypothetical protein n=1 Tax=Isoptericola sp. NPDC057391 TaxID=3346117 RepID=UPI0036286397